MNVTLQVYQDGLKIFCRLLPSCFVTLTIDIDDRNYYVVAVIYVTVTLHFTGRVGQVEKFSLAACYL